MTDLLTSDRYISLSEEGFASLANISAFIAPRVFTEGRKWAKKSSLETRVILPRMSKTILLGQASRGRAEIWYSVSEK